MTPPRSRRRGAAAVELALVLPFLAFIFVVTVDYCRVFYFTQVVTTCARNGALWASDPVAASQSPYATIEAATRGDAGPTLGPQLTVTTTTGTDTGGAYTNVTVKYQFNLITSYPGVPQTVNITRSATSRPAPLTPN